MAQEVSGSSSKRIIVIGGSYGGISTAHYLLKHVIPNLSESTAHKIVLVSSSLKAMCRPACPRAMISDEMFSGDKLFASIPLAFEHYPKQHFTLVHGTATKLDHIKRTVTVSVVGGDVETLRFHALVIATGASTPSPLLGLNRDEVFLRKQWESFRKALPNAKNIVISGGGPAGVEAAGELGEYLNGQPGWFASKLAHSKVPITVVTAGTKILPALRPAIADKAEDYLSHVGVTVVRNARVKAVEPAGAGTEDVTAKALITLEDGRNLEADLYIPATGTVPNSSFVDKELLDADGRVNTNNATLRVEKAGPRIYAIGDVASHARPAIHHIISAVPVLCTNIRRDLLLDLGSSVGKQREWREDTRETQLVPIGRSRGVGAAMGWQLPSFMVWLIKGRDYWLWTTGALWSGKQWAKES